MSSGSWLLSKSFVQRTTNVIFSFWESEIFFFIRCFINAVGMVIIASLCEKSDEYLDLLGPIFRHAKISGDWILTMNLNQFKIPCITNSEKEKDENELSLEERDFETVKI